MFRKLFFILVLGYIFIPFFIVQAATDASSQIPELNPFCWHRADCYKIRQTFFPPGSNPSPTELEQGFIKDASVAPCTGGTGDEQWGRCLPAGTSKTEISFGGKSEFSNIGEFIILMYKYLVTIASIVAVVVVIVAGMQWVTSGGNSEAIGSAKKRIGGALIGLFIAYMSYFVLNTINPALVNLRLPQVWLIKPVAELTEYCSDLPGAKEGKLKFAKVAGVDEPNKPAPPAAERDYIKWETMACGSRFLAANGGEQVCRGNSCDIAGKGNPENKTCFDKKGDRTGYECGHVRMAGDITSSVLIQSCNSFFMGRLIEATGLSTPWGCPPIAGANLVVVCNSHVDVGAGFGAMGLTSMRMFGDGSIVSNGRRYWVEKENSKILSDVVHLCNKLGGVKGFVAIFEMEKEAGIGSVGVGAGAGGLVAGPIGGAVGGIAGGLLGGENEKHFVGKGGVDLGEYTKIDNLYKTDPRYLFTLEEITKGAHLNVDTANIKD